MRDVLGEERGDKNEEGGRLKERSKREGTCEKRSKRVEREEAGRLAL
jgi:hypothetical protein